MFCACFAGAQTAQPPAGAWRYDLRPGDRLVYEQIFTRETTGPDVRAKSQARFTNQVVVASQRNGVMTVGFERDRVSAELLMYRRKGQDQLARERVRFAERVGRQPARFSEANEITPDGASRALWQAVREASSRVLTGLHEIEALPQRAVKVGDQWAAGNVFLYRSQLTAMEMMAGESCAAVSGAVADSGVKLRYWFCPASGVIRRIEFDARYVTVGGEAHETVSLELKEQRRGETVQSWLAADAQQAALHAIIQSGSVQFSPVMLLPCLQSSDARTQALALAVVYRRVNPADIPRALLEVLPALAKSNDVEVARMAARVLGGAAQSQVQPAAAQRFAEELPGTYLRPMTTPRHEGSPFILDVPLDYRGDEAFPLLVMLSGGPGFAMDGANTSQSAIGGLGYLVLYPNAGGRMWWEPDVAKNVEALLDEVTAQFNVDRTRIYLTGFSNGGTGAAYYASLWPNRFRAVVSLMGAAECAAPIQMRNLDSVPVLFVHGDKDPIIPSRCSEDAYKALRKRSPANKEFQILAGREHDITLSTDGGLAVRFFAKYGGQPAGAQNQPER